MTGKFFTVWKATAGLFCLSMGLEKQEMYGQTRSNFSDRKSTRLNSSHPSISYAVFCLKKKIVLCVGDVWSAPARSLLPLREEYSCSCRLRELCSRMTLLG